MELLFNTRFQIVHFMPLCLCSFVPQRLMKRKIKNKAKCRPLAGNPKHEILNPKQAFLTECDFKKQSQFAGLWPEIRSTKYEIRNRHG